MFDIHQLLIIRDLPRAITAAGKNYRTLSALGMVTLAAVVAAYFWTHPGFSQTVGSDSVVIGQVSPNAKIGDRSVIIGPTDARGNTVLNQSMAVGKGRGGGVVHSVPMFEQGFQYRVV